MLIYCDFGKKSVAGTRQVLDNYKVNILSMEHNLPDIRLLVGILDY